MKHNLTFGSDEEPKLSCLWISDAHLDAIETPKPFFELIQAHTPDLLLIGGDLANGHETDRLLKEIDRLFSIPIYFVLGNHDFYTRSIEKTKEEVGKLSAHSQHLHYLSHEEVIALSNKVALVGDDGWADGRAGCFATSNVMLNDYILIQELKYLTPYQREKKLNELGDESAQKIAHKVGLALKAFDQVILLTHVPPFREVSFYGDTPSDDNWAPHFVNKAAGMRLKALMEKNPTKHLLVLAGHTHTGVDVEILPNLRVLTGESLLRFPSIQGLIYVPLK